MRRQRRRVRTAVCCDPVSTLCPVLPGATQCLRHGATGSRDLHTPRGALRHTPLPVFQTLCASFSDILGASNVAPRGLSLPRGFRSCTRGASQAPELNEHSSCGAQLCLVTKWALACWGSGAYLKSAAIILNKVVIHRTDQALLFV